MGLPILKLPYLALKVLVDHFNYVELVTVSLVSRRADWVLKTCGKKPVPFFDMQGSEIRDLFDFDKIPFLALKVFVNHLGDVELVTVSVLSRRTDWLLKACGKNNVSFFKLRGIEIGYLRQIQVIELFLLESRRQSELPEWNFQLCYSVSYDQHISISCEHFFFRIRFEILDDIEKFVGIRRRLKIGESFVPLVITNDDGVKKTRTFWSSETDGMIAFMNFFKNKFNLPIQQLKFAGNRSRDIRTIVTQINSTQTVVKNVLVSVHPPLSADDFDFVLKNVSATENLSSHLILSQDFKFIGKIRAKIIKIHYGHWFTLENLAINTENEEIYVNGSDYLREELRSFLKEWVSGRLPKLKEVKLATRVCCLDVTRGFSKRRVKCQNDSGRTVEAVLGHGDSYGIVDLADRGQGYFRMKFYNGGLLQ
ncbi:hypothetical protein CAEBREN_20268 [Caenorhabditis brenneri]|uniref:F-box domain-containing protein n=1 Tax=Caenorhabditis brenneri TaxID=135651 RepID=G0NPH9_CAEBE|nr:hypothetical protein CAEBREN_20268 [Caenorhabditis brenneri]